jgi:osmoprotectant transport system substrate-binding protein
MRRLVVPLLALVLVGCHSGDRIVVGSKNFSEQVLLGEIVAQAIEQSGLGVDRRLNLGGTFVCDRALRAGEIDVYVEYTGTAYTAILKHPPGADRQEILRQVRVQYGEAGLEWLEPLGFENTFAMIVRGDDAEHLGLRTISDLTAHPEFRAAFGYEFMERADGFPGLARKYGLGFRERPRVMDLGLLYRALVDHQADIVAGNSTDGQITSLLSALRCRAGRTACGSRTVYWSEGRSRFSRRTDQRGRDAPPELPRLRREGFGGAGGSRVSGADPAK